MTASKPWRTIPTIVSLPVKCAGKEGGTIIRSLMPFEGPIHRCLCPSVHCSKHMECHGRMIDPLPKALPYEAATHSNICSLTVKLTPRITWFSSELNQKLRTQKWLSKPSQDWSKGTLRWTSQRIDLWPGRLANRLRQRRVHCGLSLYHRLSPHMCHTQLWRLLGLQVCPSLTCHLLSP